MTIQGSDQKQSDISVSYKKRISVAIAIKLLLCFSLSIICGFNLRAQGKIWCVDDCIKYALEQNIQVLKERVTTNIDEANLLLAKAGRLHTV